MSMAAADDRDAVPSELKTQLKRLNLLHQITRAVAEQRDMQTIFQVVVRSLEDQLPADFVCVCLYDPARPVLTVAHVGVRNGPLMRELGAPGAAQIALDTGPLSRSLNGQLVYEPDIAGMDSAFLQRLAGHGLHTLAAMPLVADGVVLGLLMAARQPRDAFSNTDCEFLHQLCEHVALAAHQAKLHTELQKAYDELRMTQQAAMQQERLRALGQMAGGIAHDISNAISPVTLYTDAFLEREPNLSERMRTYLETMRRVVNDIAGTVGRLQDFYLEREQHAVSVPVDLNEVVQHVVELTKARWNDMPQRRGIVISLQCALDKSLPAIRGADYEIREALTNLVFNAVDALPHGGMITIRTSRADARIVLEVSDNGTGMDDVTRQRCMEPFFTTKGERGTGLGLATVFGIATRHKADIEIETVPERGTKFRMSFPAMEEAAAAQPSSAAVPDAAHPMRLLIVDDDPFVLDSLRTVLEFQGHTIVEANGGREGIDAFATAHTKGEPFAAVITDLGMPYIDGIQVARAVKLQSPATPVILLTGWGGRMKTESEAMANVDFFLGKPPKLKELRQVLAQLSGKS